MGYHIKHVIYVDILTTSIEVNIKNELKNGLPYKKKMGYYIKHVIDVDVLTTSIEINIQNK
jgi:hypothetical protein